MAEMIPEQPEDAAPAIGGGIPTDPAELAAWKERFTEELLGRPHDDWSSEPVHKGVRREGS